MEQPTGTTKTALPPGPLGSFPLCADYGRDVPEAWIRKVAPVVLDILLADRSAGRNILWCTDDYAERGVGYGFSDEITPSRICGDPVIRPRVDKRIEEQKARVAAKGEVFTPAWVCNAQNNLVDQAWFNARDIFNTVGASGRDWTPTPKTALWKTVGKNARAREYVALVRLEVACGEAPYLTSRYDAATGESIPSARRIGLLDRKLRLVSDLSERPERWLEGAKTALKSLYAYDWQGDNVLLARENLLFATLEAFAVRWPDVRFVSASVVESLATIISWNVFQMDGVKFVVPGTCHGTAAPEPPPSLEIGDEPAPPPPRPCPGCATGDHSLHNGVRPVVIDWSKTDFEPRSVPFHELFPKP